MLEMNGGRRLDATPSPTSGLRHGPMSAIRPDTLVVAFLSSDPLVRAYELRPAARARPQDARGATGRAWGRECPQDVVASEADARRSTARSAASADEDLTLLDALVGQLLAFFRCLGSGYRPDSPSADGVISRVVSGFEIHRRDGAR